MATAPNPTDWNPNQHWTSTDFHTSARLHLQHWLFQGSLGFLLHPTILKDLETKTDEIRIADVGCGNGAWLCDLADHLPFPSTITPILEGYDITPVNFPHPAYLPTSPPVSLHTLDLLATPLPASLKNKYDVLHIRAFSSIIRHNDTTPLLSAVTHLLKPGGWLQWDEAPPHRMCATSPDPSSLAPPTTASTTLLHLIAASGARIGTQFTFLDNLPSLLSSHTSSSSSSSQAFLAATVAVTHHPNRPAQYKAWTEDYLLVYEELAAYFPSEASGAPEGTPMTKEAYQRLFGAVVAETQRGVVLQQGEVICAIAQRG